LIIKRLAQHYINVISNVLTDPICSPHHIGLLSNDELEEQLIKWNNHPIDNAWHVTKPIATIHALVEESARHHSQRIAIIHNQRSITYEELNKAANRLAHFLIDNRYVQEIENLVVVLFDRSIHFFIAILAVLKAGGAYVPIDTGTPQERLLFIIDDTRTRLLLVGSKEQEYNYRDHLPTHVNVLVIDDVLTESDAFCSLSEQTPLSSSNIATSRNLAYVIYTSGSTGTPKGVLIEHRSAIWYRDSAQYHYSFPDGAMYDFSSSIAFDLSVTSTVVPMVNGGTVIVCGDDVKRDIFKFYSHIVKNQVQIIKCTPSYFVQMTEAFCGDSDIKLTDLSTVIIGGELLHGERVRQWLHKFPHQKVFNEYGPTETTVGVSQFLIDLQNVDSVTVCERDLAIGKAFPYSGLYILDHNNEPLPFGLTGELCIGGPCLARGYLNRNDLTHARFIEIELSTLQKIKTRVYRSGDKAYYLDSMDVQCIGRVDHQVKIRGYRVELEEIEHKIKICLNTCQVYVMKTSDHIPRLISFIGGYSKSRQEAEITLRKHLENTLPDYMHPEQYIFLDQFPLTINEKIDSKSLAAMVQSENQRKSAQDNYTSPRNLTEFRLYKLWSSLLGVKKFGIYEDFFKLGGHSLLIISLTVKITKIFKRVLSVATVVRHPTIEKLARCLTVVFQDNEEDLILPISTKTVSNLDRKPLFLIHAVEGISFVYAALASFFDTQQSIMALNSPTFIHLEKKFCSIEEMATFYISIIQKNQLHGPYYLGGWCFGGKVAYEMAHQLEILGEPVNLILLLDSYLTETYKDFHVYDEEAFDQSIRNYVTGEGINPSSAEAEYFKYEIKNNILMSFKYEPPPYLGRVVLIKADINHDEEDVDFLDPFNGCKNSVQSEIELYSVHCEHTKMFDSVNIDQVAARIKCVLSTDTADPVLSRIDLSCESRHFLHAAHNRDYFFLDRFLELGADINAQDDEGRTALHWAAHFNDCQILECFKNVLPDKIDFNKKDLRGETPINIARRQLHHECVDMLEKLLFRR
jgi:amino acid adenylation domain-containing protein